MPSTRRTRTKEKTTTPMRQCCPKPKSKKKILNVNKLSKIKNKIKKLSKKKNTTS